MTADCRQETRTKKMETTMGMRLLVTRNLDEPERGIDILVTRYFSRLVERDGLVAALRRELGTSDSIQLVGEVNFPDNQSGRVLRALMDMDDVEEELNMFFLEIFELGRADALNKK